MWINRVIINSSPLIVLLKSQQANFGIQALRDAGLWLSDSLVNLLKQQAGE
jgi:hypothetical protein